MNKASVLEGVAAAEDAIEEVYADCPPSPAELIGYLTQLRANPDFCRGFLVTLVNEDLLLLEEAQMIIAEVAPTTIERTKVPKAFCRKKSKK
jgi:hypothetical protein